MLLTKDEITEEYGDGSMMFLDYYDDCVVGVVHRFGQPPIICYDKDEIIKTDMNDGMTYDDAMESFDYNIIGGWLGEDTPCFLSAVTVGEQSKFKKCISKILNKIKRGLWSIKLN